MLRPAIHVARSQEHIFHIRHLAAQGVGKGGPGLHAADGRIQQGYLPTVILAGTLPKQAQGVQLGQTVLHMAGESLIQAGTGRAVQHTVREGEHAGHVGYPCLSSTVCEPVAAVIPRQFSASSGSS